MLRPMAPCSLRRFEEQEKESRNLAEIAERQKRGVFSEEAIANLSRRLLGGGGGGGDSDEMMKEKLVCLAASDGHDGPLSWLTARESHKATMVVGSSDIGSSAPTDLQGFGCTVWKSTKIIIAGGFTTSQEGRPPCISNKVFVYNIASKTWDPPSYMKLKRPQNPTPVVVDDTLFIFGGRPVYDFDELNRSLEPSDIMDSGEGEMMDYYYDDRVNDPPLTAICRKVSVEFCCNIGDTTTSWSWNYLPPSHRPPYDNFPSIRTHLVYPQKNRILFWALSLCRVIFFDYTTGNWGEYKPYMPINQTRSWSNSVVILEDFIFWYARGDIYANDLIGNVTRCMCTISTKDMFFQSYCNHSLPTFLVHLGKGTLCLFGGLPQNRIFYCTLWVQIGRSYGPPTLKVVVANRGFLDAPTPMSTIRYALEYSAGE